MVYENGCAHGARRTGEPCSICANQTQAASPPAPSVPDVVREWEAEADNYLKRDPLRLAGNLMRDELTRMAGELKSRQELDNVTTLGVPGEATYPAPDHGWTCFHCGQTFPTAFLAEQHFGRFPKGTPACRFKGDFDLLEKLRAAESQLAAQAKTIEGGREEYALCRTLLMERTAEVERLTGEVAKLKQFPSGDFDEEVARLIRCLQLPDFEAEGFTKACTDAANMLESLEWGNVDLRQGLATAEASLETARAALVRIEKWFGEFPPTGKYWDDERTKPISYSAEYGSNGERDFMRAIARTALAALPSPPITKIKGEG